MAVYATWNATLAKIIRLNAPVDDDTLPAHVNLNAPSLDELWQNTRYEFPAKFVYSAEDVLITLMYLKIYAVERVLTSLFHRARSFWKPRVWEIILKWSKCLAPMVQNVLYLYIVFCIA